MRMLLLAATAGVSLLGASIAAAGPTAGQSPQLIFGVDRAGEMPTLEPAQFIFRGQTFCWYDAGWQGPGFYLCGYSERRGYGWGGAAGWNGWQGRGGRGYAGARNAGGYAHDSSFQGGHAATTGAAPVRSRGSSARASHATASRNVGGAHAARRGSSTGDRKPGA